MSLGNQGLETSNVQTVPAVPKFIALLALIFAAYAAVGEIDYRVTQAEAEPVLSFKIESAADDLPDLELYESIRYAEISQCR